MNGPCLYWTNSVLLPPATVFSSFFFLFYFSPLVIAIFSPLLFCLSSLKHWLNTSSIWFRNFLNTSQALHTLSDSALGRQSFALTFRSLTKFLLFLVINCPLDFKQLFRSVTFIESNCGVLQPLFTTQANNRNFSQTSVWGGRGREGGRGRGMRDEGACNCGFIQGFKGDNISRLRQLKIWQFPWIPWNEVFKFVHDYNFCNPYAFIRCLTSVLQGVQ